jgi:hypothetical protein
MWPSASALPSSWARTWRPEELATDAIAELNAVLGLLENGEKK